MRKLILILFLLPLLLVAVTTEISDQIGQNEITSPVAKQILVYEDQNGVLVLKNEPYDSLGISTNKIKDADGDTYVDVEQTSDCDSIRFKAGGTYVMSMTSDGTVLEEPLNAGKLQLTADGETMTLADMAVSDTPAAGTDMSAGFKIDANDIFRYGAEADGSGGIQNEYVTLNGDLNSYDDDGSSRYWHEYVLSAFSANAGASGATFIAPDDRTVGGMQLNAVGEVLYYETHVENDWDGTTDLILEVYFESLVDNSGGAGTDTVDLKVVFFYKGIGENSTNIQTVEVATIVGTTAEFAMFEAKFTINYDLANNVVQVGDVFGMILNLETDTSEVDNIIINYAEFKYETTKPSPETP